MIFFYPRKGNFYDIPQSSTPFKNRITILIKASDAIQLKLSSLKPYCTCCKITSFNKSHDTRSDAMFIITTNNNFPSDSFAF